MIKLIKKYILSYDVIISIMLSVSCFIYFPEWIQVELIKDILSMGIGVLSIIFSIFFATLAFVISSSDDEFVSFLEEYGLFTRIINSFKWTVGSLFVSLIYSIIIYSISTINFYKEDKYLMSKYVLVIFCFLFFYSLIATLISTFDAITYSKKRIEHLKIMKKN